MFWAISEIISYLEIISENKYSLLGFGKTMNNSFESLPLFQAVPSENEWKCRCGKINRKNLLLVRNVAVPLTQQFRDEAL